MNTAQTDERVAGRELDAEVAEKVMGWRVERKWAQRDPDCGDWNVCPLCHPSDGSRPDRCQRDSESEQPSHQPFLPQNPGYWEVVAEYSTDIAAAWQVVERLTNEERGFELWRENMAFREYEATFYPDSYQRWTARADTAPLAICRAALAAVSS